MTFSRRVLRTRAPFAVDVTVRDTAGKLVVGAKVSVVSVPSTRTKPVARRTTSSTGKAHFVVTPTRRLPLVRDGRLSLYVRGWSPNATQSSITAKRLVSIRVAR